MAARGQCGAGARQVECVEAPWPVRHQRVGFEVALVEGLQRMLEHDGIAHTARRDPHRVLRHVEQLADGNSGRAAQIGAFVAAGVRDDQVIPGRQQRVEQQLTILAARVPVADLLVARVRSSPSRSM